MVLNQFFAELTTTNGVIVVGLIYKRSVDLSTKKNSVALEPLISSVDPRGKINIMGEFNINMLDNNLSPPVENFINQMISKNFLPIINRPTISILKIKAGAQAKSARLGQRW